MMKAEHPRKNSTLLNRMAGPLVLSKRTVFLFWMCVTEAMSPSVQSESCRHRPESLQRLTTYPFKPALPISTSQFLSSLQCLMIQHNKPLQGVHVVIEIDLLNRYVTTFST